MRLRYWLTPDAILRELGLYTRLRNRVYPVYACMYEPPQLSFLCDALSSVRRVPGSVLEVGCAYGNTTLFLNHHLDAEGIDKAYHALDTFEGFRAEEIAHERSRRDKTSFPYERKFVVNNIRWFRQTMRVGGVTRVTAYKADASTFDYSVLGRLAFVLIDVDLYKPVAGSLERIWPLVSSGGIVIIDDCWHGHVYDGAFQAYQEFIKTHDLPEEIRRTKLGVLRKP